MDKNKFYDIDSTTAAEVKEAVRPVVAEPQQVQKISPLANNLLGENIMAEVDTQMLSNQHGDIRRESAEHASDIRREQAGYFADGRYAGATQTSDIRREIAQSTYDGVGATKDARHDVLREVDRSADRLDNQATQFYIAGQGNATVAARDLATLTALTEANASSMRAEIQLNVEKAAAAAALSSEKVATAVALGQSTLSKEIFMDGQKTRDLINDLKYHDLNRALVERNAELVDERHSGRHWRHVADQSQFAGQFAQLQTQIQAFASQLQETRQGMVNFGTMAGVGQSSTSNNVR